MCYTATYRPVDGLTGENPIDQPGSKGVTAPDAVQNIDLALWNVHNLILIKRDGSPCIAARGVRGAQVWQSFQFAISGGYIAQHLS